MNLHAPESVENFSHTIGKNRKLVHQENTKCKLNLHLPDPVDVPAIKLNKNASQKKKNKQSAELALTRYCRFIIGKEEKKQVRICLNSEKCYLN